MRVVTVPALRLRAVNTAPPRAGDFILYWTTAARRTHHNFALDRAVELARAAGEPLLVFEALRLDYPWASRRLHAFVVAGMRDNRARCEAAGVGYYPYIEPSPGAGRGLLAALAERASQVVTDDAFGFFQPRMIEAAGRNLHTRLEAVDGAGLLPVRAADKAFARAVDFRRFLQRQLLPHLDHPPSPDPFAAALRPFGRLPRAIETRWPAADLDLDLARLPFACEVSPAGLTGGPAAGARRLATFLEQGLARYDDRKHPDLGGGSGLSPYLHFGHVGAHQVWSALVRHEGWSPDAIGPRRAGQKDGFWGMSAPAEAFVDELVTWRELGHGACAHRPDFAEYESLPGWALATLEQHAGDPRPHLYSLEELERAETHDPIWNSAQRQLLRDGVIHGYLRMLWGKKVLEWSPSPRAALTTMIELNNKYALDGRDPSSYSGIFWCLGRYDRPWAPERAIFGRVRYMSSAATQKKLRLTRYLARYGPGT